MDPEITPPPWAELERTTRDIPWPALRAFADAVVTDPEVARRLFDAYDHAYENAFDQTTYTDLYVPAIFALAAPKLDDEKRWEIGSWLIGKMGRAARDDADLTLEALEAAAGTMGPVVLPAVLDAIASEPDMYGAWFHLWGLTVLAAKSDDAELRGRVIRACVELLEKADRGEIRPGEAMNAAWTLASLKDTEHTDLLQRLGGKAAEDSCQADYESALKLLQGRLDYTPRVEPWEEPVEEWLTSQCRMAEQGSAEQDAYEEEPDEDEAEVSPLEEYAQLLTRTFVSSRVAAGLPPELLHVAHLIVHDLVHLSLKYLDTKPRDWDEAAMREILLVLIPRDTPADRELLGKIAPIAEAFLYWLGMEGLLTDADALAMMVHDWSDQIVAAGTDRKNWGPVKTFIMETREAGVDAMNKDRVTEFLTRQLTEAVEAVEHLPEPSAPARREPPIPIVEHPSKPARNAPCPCGSGKKYKKCHGRPDAEQTSIL